MNFLIFFILVGIGGVGGGVWGGGSGVQRLGWLVGGREPATTERGGYDSGWERGVFLGFVGRAADDANFAVGGGRGGEGSKALEAQTSGAGRSQPERAGRIRPDSFQGRKIGLAGRRPGSGADTP